MGDLFVISRANIFEEYPRLLRNLMEKSNEQQINDAVNNLLLPSDSEYKDYIYYKMLDSQKEINSSLFDKM